MTDGAIHRASFDSLVGKFTARATCPHFEKQENHQRKWRMRKWALSQNVFAKDLTDAAGDSQVDLQEFSSHVPQAPLSETPRPSAAPSPGSGASTFEQMADPSKILSDEGIEIDVPAKEKGIDQSDSELFRATAAGAAGAVKMAEIATIAASDVAVEIDPRALLEDWKVSTEKIASMRKGSSSTAKVLQEGRARSSDPSARSARP